jgi:hypothetical protein
MKPSFLVSVFDCGHVQNRFSTDDQHVLVLGIEDERTAYVIDHLPIADNSPSHRIACAVTGYSLRASDISLSGLLGKVFNAEIDVTHDGAFLRRVDVFPKGPRHERQPMVITTQDERLGGKLGAPIVVGGELHGASNPLPTPPEPRTEPRQWSVRDLRRPQLPPGLPPLVVELVQRSREFESLQAPARK